MGKIILAAVSSAVIAIALGGCGSSSSDNTIRYTSGTINYADGSIFGITKEEASANGGFNIYDINLINLLGFIRMDGLVTNVNGVNIGACVGASISDSGVSGSCNVPINNPNILPPTAGQCSSEVQALWEESRIAHLDFCLNFPGTSDPAECYVTFDKDTYICRAYTVNY